MKKLCSLFIMLLTISSIMAQAPQLMNFQGVARNSVGNVLSNKNITVRLTVHDATATGTALYSETRAITTNAFGLFNIVIGSAGATTTTGSISTISWLVNKKYLQLEIDPLGGSAFTDIGTTQLVSVPYAFSAGQALPSGPAGGSLTGTFPNPSIGTGVVTATNMAAGVIPTTLPPNGAAGGSLAGTYPNPTLGAGVVTAANMAAGVIPTTLPPSGTAGGDLSGTYPNPSLLIPLTKTSAQTTNALVTLNNSATTGILGALQASSASATAKAVALQGTISSTAPGPYSIAVNGVNNGTGSLGIGVSGVSMGSGWGVYGLATLGGSNAAGVLGEVASSATSGGYGIWGINNNMGGNGGYFKNNSADAASRALLTSGAIQFQGLGAAVGKVLTSDATGNATWQNLPAGTGITGSGTLNYLPKFTPSGTVLGNSQIFDDATNVGINKPTPTAKLYVNGSSDATEFLGGQQVDHQGLIVQNASTATTKAARAIIGYAANSSSENHGVLAFANGTGTCNNVGSFNAAFGVTSGTNYGIYANVSNSTSSNVGILTSVPFGVNDYAAILKGKVQIQDGTEAAGKVLTSDAVGKASWQNVITPDVHLSSISHTPISIPIGTIVVLKNWTSLSEAGGANYNPTTGEYTIPVAGYYSVKSQIGFSSTTPGATGNGRVEIFLQINGGVYSNFGYETTITGFSLPSIHVDIEKYFSVGDKIQVAVDHSNTVNLLTQSNFCNLAIHLIHI